MEVACLTVMQLDSNGVGRHAEVSRLFLGEGLAGWSYSLSLLLV